MPDLAKSLALEVSETSLALFRCEEDIPVECLAAVERDDPAFTQKTAEFRKLAEKLVGKQVETDIWLTDDQVILRQVKLDEKARGTRRAAAASALSASCAHRAEALCFDIGETGRDGYTPLAAIPKKKMEQAMAFASEMRLNPRGVTTSNDVQGFGTRPQFQPFAMPTAARLPAGRIAAMLAVLALPVLYAIGGLDQLASGLDRVGSAGLAAVATTPVPLDEQLDFSRPASATRDEHSFHIAPELPLPPGADPRPLQPATHTARISLMTRAPVAIMVSPAMTMRTSVSRHGFSGMAPRLPLVGPAENETLRPGMGGMPVQGPTLKGIAAGLVAYSTPRQPRPMQRAGLTPDALPNTGTIAPGPDWIDALGPITYLASDSSFDDAASFDIANIPEGVLVRRPGARPEERILQPRATRPAVARPGPSGPFADVNAATTDFAAPAVPPTAPSLPARSAPLGANTSPPVAHSMAMDPALIHTITTTGTLLRRDAAPLEPTPNGEGITAIRPPLRTIIPAPDDPGANIQTSIQHIPPPPDEGTSPLPPVILSTDVAPNRGAFGVLKVPENAADSAFTLDPAERLTALDRAPPRQARPPIRADIQIALEVAASLLSNDPAPSSTALRPPLRAVAAPSQSVVSSNTDTPPSFDEPTPGTGPADLQTAVTPADINTASLQRPPFRDGSPFVEPGATPPAEPVSPATDAATGATPENLQQNSTTTMEVGRVTSRPPMRVIPKAGETAVTNETTPGIALADGQAQFASPRPRPARANVTTERFVGGGAGGAVLAALAPIHRPASLAARAASIRKERARVASSIAARQQPTRTTPSSQLAIPSSARVAATATIENGIDLGDVSLIGIFGKSNARRALIRSQRGQIVQVKRGGRVSGWAVSAIGDDTVRLQKGSKNKTLRMPSE